MVILLHFMICHSRKCHRPCSSSCHKGQRSGTWYIVLLRVDSVLPVYCFGVDGWVGVLPVYCLGGGTVLGRELSAQVLAYPFNNKRNSAQAGITAL